MYENPTADRLAEMTSAKYAHFSVLGTWNYRREPCNVCNYYWQEIISPLLVRWEPSTEEIGDFSWDGPFGSKFLLKRNVVNTFESIGFDCLFFPISIVRPKRKRNTVPFPYVGPELLWAKCNDTVDLDREASGVKVESSCVECGDTRYTFRKSGILIRRKNWNQQMMFRISTNGPDVVFVTEEGRHRIRDAGLSNVEFTEAGEIVQ